MKTEFRHAGAILSIVLLVVSGCRSIGSAPEPAGIATAGQDVTAQLSLARLSERHGDPDYAAQMYRVILSENPNNPTAHHRLAVIAAQQQRLDDADRHFERAMAAADPTAELLSDRAYAYYLRHDLDNAERLAREALSKSPQNQTARNNLALVLGERGQFEESLNEFRRVVGEAEAQANLAYAKTMAGDLAGAEETYHLALQRDSQLRPAAQALLELHDRRIGIVRDASPEIAFAPRRAQDPNYSAAVGMNARNPTSPATRSTQESGPKHSHFISDASGQQVSPTPSRAQPASFQGGRRNQPQVTLIPSETQGVPTGGRWPAPWQAPTWQAPTWQGGQ